MTIRYSKHFVKQLARQPAGVQKAFYRRLKLFRQNPDDPLLRRHVLQGKFKGFCSINVTGDVRALYEVIDNQIYLYVMIGTHSQLYG